MHNSEVCLAHPAISHGSLGESNNALRTATVFHNICNHVSVVVKPDHVEVIHGVFYATPLTVLVKSCVADIEITKASLFMGLAIPEVLGHFLYVFWFVLFFRALFYDEELAIFCFYVFKSDSHLS